MMAALTVDIYEGQTLVVRHVFFGATHEDAIAILKAHQGADAFLSQCMAGGCYKGQLPCRAVTYWSYP